MSKFKKIAQEMVSISPLAAGRTKLKTEDVVNKQLTIVAFDLVNKYDHGKLVVDDNGEVKTYGLVVFKELPDRFYTVGKVFTDVCCAWAKETNGDTVAASAEIEAEGGVPVKFYPDKTNSGNNLTNVEIL